MTEAMRSQWDAEADRFDDEPDHGLRDPAVRRAWADLLAEVLPPPPGRVLDVGLRHGHPQRPAGRHEALLIPVSRRP